MRLFYPSDRRYFSEILENIAFFLTKNPHERLYLLIQTISVISVRFEDETKYFWSDEIFYRRDGKFQEQEDEYLDK